MKKILNLLFLVFISSNSFAISFNNENICKASISSIFYKSPSIIKSIKSGNIYYLSYIRASDNLKWSFKCKVVGNNVVWGNKSGRWRNHKLDSKVTYKEENGTLKIIERYSDGSKTIKKFTLKDLK
jgi:hypothetical protein